MWIWGHRLQKTLRNLTSKPLHFLRDTMLDLTEGIYASAHGLLIGTIKFVLG